MNTIREYLKGITERSSQMSQTTKYVLESCEQEARHGKDFYVTGISANDAEDTINYLVTVAKLDVEVLRQDYLTTVKIDWNGK